MSIPLWTYDADLGLCRRLDNGNYDFLPHREEVVTYVDHVADKEAARAEIPLGCMTFADAERIKAAAVAAARAEAGGLRLDNIRAGYEQGQRDERDRIRRFIVGLTTTEHTRHFAETILWHIDKGDSDE